MKIINFSQSPSSFRFTVQFSGNINEEIEWLCNIISAVIASNFSIDIDYDPNEFREGLLEEIYKNPVNYEVTLIVDYNFDRAQLRYGIDVKEVKGHK